jgi:disulfide bond formation protein DsbB
MRRPLLAACTLVAVVATLGSLYFSEVAGYFPCELCWYQRILMYPLVPVLGVAAYENRAGVWKSTLPLSVLGIGVAAHHTRIQLTPSATCSVGGCGSIQWQAGIFTIPRLSLVAFLLITAGLALVAVGEYRGTDLLGSRLDPGE